MEEKTGKVEGGAFSLPALCSVCVSSFRLFNKQFEIVEEQFVRLAVVRRVETNKCLPAGFLINPRMRSLPTTEISKEGRIWLIRREPCRQESIYKSTEALKRWGANPDGPAANHP